MRVRFRSSGLDVCRLPALRRHAGLVAIASPLASAALVAFLGTADAVRSKSFYNQVLGLPLLEETSFASVYQAPNATLRVTVVDRVAPAPHTALGWQVPDITAAVTALRRRGVSFVRYEGMDQDELGVWRSPSGARVAWFADPDQNVLSVTQL